MTTAVEIKDLHDEVVYFVTNKMGMPPTGLSDDIKGWPPLMQEIAAKGPEAITFDQLKRLADYTAIIADPTRTNLGLGGIKNQYTQAGFEGKIKAAMGKHPGNRAFGLLQNFFRTQMRPMEEAFRALDGLNPIGVRYQRSAIVMDTVDQFMGALRKLDPNYGPDSRPDQYVPDMGLVMAELGNNKSPLLVSGLQDMGTLCDNVHTALGPPEAKAGGLRVPMSFKDHQRLVERAYDQWLAVKTALNDLRLGPTRAK